MKVLIWTCGFEKRHAGSDLYREAKAKGFDVAITGSRSNPKQMVPMLYEYKPDVVFCFAILPQLKPYYELIKSLGIKLVFWYPDMAESSRDRWWRTMEGYADLIIFSILETAQRYAKLAPNVLWMPQYFDANFCKKDGQLPKRLDANKRIYDLVFIGATDRTRQQWLEELAKHYDCNFVLNAIGRSTELRGYPMAEAYAQSRIAFNIQRKLFTNVGPYVTSNRTYNAMGSGAFFINHNVCKLDFVFKKGFHCEMHRDTIADLRRLIDYYLEHDDLRESIAYEGQCEVLKYHSLHVRTAEYWQVMAKMRAGEHIIPTGKLPAYGEWVTPMVADHPYPINSRCTDASCCNVIHCMRCNYAMRGDAQFCNKCGTPVND